MLILTGCFSLAVAKSTPSGPTTRDQSHIEETLRLATAEPSREFVGESYIEINIYKSTTFQGYAVPYDASYFINQSHFSFTKISKW